MKTSRALKMLAALSQETRLAIFKLLIRTDAEGISAGSIAEQLKIPAATLSFHLTQLSDAKLIEARREGRQIYYLARPKSVKKLYRFLTEGAFTAQEEASESYSIMPSSIEDDDENDGLDDDSFSEKT